MPKMSGVTVLLDDTIVIFVGEVSSVMNKLLGVVAERNSETWALSWMKSPMFTVFTAADEKTKTALDCRTSEDLFP